MHLEKANLILMRDTGMRNQRELYNMRIENLDWQGRVIFVPDSKTAEGRRLVPMSRRVSDLLRARCGTRSEGWVFPSNRAASGHLRSIDRLFREARHQAGLPKELVLYCARHDYGTRVLMRTGNLAAVMKTMGHRDIKTAIHYQHPELDIVRAALDYGAASETAEMRAWRKKVTTPFTTHPKKPQPWQVIDNCDDCAREENPSRIIIFSTSKLETYQTKLPATLPAVGRACCIFQ